jgi:hypothetical protein
LLIYWLMLLLDIRLSVLWMVIVGDSPRGPLKQRGNPHLKPATKPKHNLPNHTGNGPRRRDPRRPIEAALLEIPSSRLRLARGCSPPSGGLRPVRGVALPSSGLHLARGLAPPRAGSALLEGTSRPRPGSATLEGAPHACAGPRTRTFNALTPAGRRHHAPGARAPVPPHQLPREEPIPITVGRDCPARPVSDP